MSENTVKDEEICELCVSEFLKRLIDLEQHPVDLKAFIPEDLLVLIGEKGSLENIRHMSIAKDKLFGN